MSSAHLAAVIGSMTCTNIIVCSLGILGRSEKMSTGPDFWGMSNHTHTDTLIDCSKNQHCIHTSYGVRLERNNISHGWAIHWHTHSVEIITTMHCTALKLDWVHNCLLSKLQWCGVMCTLTQSRQLLAYNHNNKYIYIHIVAITDWDRHLNLRLYMY